MNADNENDDTRELIKKILNKKDPAIVGLKKILHSKRMASPGRSFTSHVPEVFNTTDAADGEATQEESLFNETEKQIIEHEHTIIELQNRIKELEESIALQREEAFQEGFSRGVEEATEKLQEEFQDQLSQVSENFSQQLADIVAQQLDDRNTQFSSLEPLVLSLAMQIAQKVVDDTIKINPEIVESSIRKAISHIAGRSEITVRVSLDDQEFTQSRIDAICDNEDSIISVRVEGSANIDKGGCLIETDTGIIDATIDNQLLEIKQCIMQSWQEFNQRESDSDQDDIIDEAANQLYQ